MAQIAAELGATRLPTPSVRAAAAYGAALAREGAARRSGAWRLVISISAWRSWLSAQALTAEPRRSVQAAQRSKRYSGAIATIQIRNVPETVHRIYQARAAAAGMSLQEYLLEELQRNAALRTPGELVAETEERMQAEGQEGFARVSSAPLLRADRDAL